MPVPAVAQDGAELTGAEVGDEPLEARTGHTAAQGGATEIVVYDLDITKTPAAGILDEMILAALALAR